MLQHDELLFEFRRDLHERRKNHHERAVLLTGCELPG
jgi:hypothetical protein